VPPEAASEIEPELAGKERFVERPDVVQEVLAEVDHHLRELRPLIAEAFARPPDGVGFARADDRHVGQRRQAIAMARDEIRKERKGFVQDARDAVDDGKRSAAWRIRLDRRRPRRDRPRTTGTSASRAVSISLSAPHR
jgi:hypothetical protein